MFLGLSLLVLGLQNFLEQHAKKLLFQVAISSQVRLYHIIFLQFKSLDSRLLNRMDMADFFRTFELKLQNIKQLFLSMHHLYTSPAIFLICIIVLLIFFKHYVLGGLGIFLFSFFFFLILEIFSFFINEKKRPFVEKRNEKLGYVFANFRALKVKLYDRIFRTYLFEKKEGENKMNFLILLFDAFNNLCWLIMPTFSAIVTVRIYVFEKDSVGIHQGCFALAVFYLMACSTRRFGRAISDYNKSVDLLNHLYKLNILLENKELILTGKLPEPKPSKTKDRPENSKSVDSKRNSFALDQPPDPGSKLMGLSISDSQSQSELYFDTREFNEVSEIEELRELDPEHLAKIDHMRNRNIAVELEDVEAAYNLYKFDRFLTNDESFLFWKIVLSISPFWSNSKRTKKSS